MITLHIAGSEDWLEIQRVAYLTWPHTFGSMIPMEHIEYMLSQIYSEASLKDQMLQKKHQFLLARQNHAVVGFASYELNCQNTKPIMVRRFTCWRKLRARV
ncbi:MAG: hypothetical protein ABI581_06150 [Sediminibacterium sp.]